MDVPPGQHRPVGLEQLVEHGAGAVGRDAAERVMQQGLEGDVLVLEHGGIERDLLHVDHAADEAGYEIESFSWVGAARGKIL